MILGYKHIITRNFIVDDNLLQVSIYENQDASTSSRIVYEVLSGKTKSIDMLQIYHGTNWLRAYDAVNHWYEERFDEKIDNVMDSLDVICNYASDVIKGGRK